MVTVNMFQLYCIDDYYIQLYDIQIYSVASVLKQLFSCVCTIKMQVSSINK